MNPTQLIEGGLVGVMGLLWMYREYIPGWFSNAMSRLRGTPGVVTPPAVAADQDVIDLAALKVIQARFARLNCPEGKAAVVICFDHFFHGTPTP